MEWSAQVNAYCERLSPAYWAEPLNAVTNAAFLIAAAVMWWRLRRQGLPLGMGLVALLAAIGVGSYLFHTHATVWAGLADVAPIGLFAILYVFAANQGFWGLGPAWALAGTVLFIPYVMAMTWVFEALPFFTISAMYWPLPLLMVVYAAFLRGRAPGTARGLAIGAAIVTVSLTFRSLDAPLCDAIPIGTHFLWHVLNGVALGWLIEVYRRHKRGPLAGATTGG